MKYKLFGAMRSIAIIAIAAVIVFSMTACPPAGPPSADVKVKAINNNGTAPPGGRSVSRAAVGTYGTDTASLSAFNTFYSASGVGAATKSTITPTKFIMAVSGIYFYDASGEWILGNGGLLDFAQTTTITVDDVPNGVTCTQIAFEFGDGIEAGWGRVEFAWPGGTTDFDAHNTANSDYYGKSRDAMTSPMVMPAFAPSWDGNKVTILLDALWPSRVAQYFSKGTVPAINRIVFDSTADKRKYGMTGQFNNIPSIIIPCNAVTVNGSVTFTISWNLNGLIEVYENTDTGSTTDDIYVLKKDFWEGLYMSIN